MDIVAHDRDGNEMCIDMVITHPAVADPCELVGNSRHQGNAAKGAESRKYQKYPECRVLYPFAMETGGRLGQVAKGVIKRFAPPKAADRTRAINELHTQLSHVVQIHNAYMILRAEGR